MVGYETARIGVDPVVFTLHEDAVQVLLQRRESGPFQGEHELPGGLLRPGERPEDRLERKLEENVGKSGIFFTQFGAFAAPDRDPRTRTVSLGYLALVNADIVNDPERWHPVEDLPGLAFDHEQIVEQAHSYLRDNLDTVIVKQFLPELFPLNDLQHAYEVILDESFDNRNFRRRMLRDGIVEKTEKKQSDVPHRPARLYRFAKG